VSTAVGSVAFSRNLQVPTAVETQENQVIAFLWSCMIHNNKHVRKVPRQSGSNFSRKMSLLSFPCLRPLYRIEKLNPPGHGVIAGVIGGALDWAILRAAKGRLLDVLFCP
jgi:hypothetical protein